MNHAALAGGVAGVVESIVVQPLDIVKTRFQLSREANPKLPGTWMTMTVPGTSFASELGLARALSWTDWARL